MRCFIRADANPEIGMGHVMRCLSIADALRAASPKHQDHQITFLLADQGVASLVQSRGFPVIVLGTDYKHMEAELTSWPEGQSDPKGQQEQPELDFMIDLIIVDSYFVTVPYLTALKKMGRTVVYIDDLAMFPYPVDILINYNAYADERTYKRLYSQQSNIYTVKMSGRMSRTTPKMPLLLLGPSYAPLRSMFQRVPHKIQPQVVKNVLLSTGGADSLHLALNTVKKLLWSNNESDESKANDESNEAGFTWHILLGALNSDKDEIRQLVAERTERAVAQNAGIVRNGSDGGIVLHENVTDMKSLIDAMDMAVSAAGSTLYEIAACGVPLITYILADNQIEGAEAFSRLGLAVNVGDLRKNQTSPNSSSTSSILNSSPVNTILAAVSYLSNSPNNHEIRKTMGELQQQIVDGRGAERLVSMMVNTLTMESNIQNIQKLYVLYIPKHYGKKSLLPQVIGDFLQKRNKQFEVIISPGFLGDKPAFIDEMKLRLSGYVSVMELYRGMSTKNKNCLDLLQYNEQGFHNSLSVPVIPHITKKDHRKMIFFNTSTNTSTQSTATVQVKTSTQLKKAEENAQATADGQAGVSAGTFVATSVQTEAILLGSSNFSYETYFGKGKGEADVFLFYDNAFATYCRGAILDEGAYADCVLSESIAMKRTETPQSYLNLIYDEFRRHA